MREIKFRAWDINAQTMLYADSSIGPYSDVGGYTDEHYGCEWDVFCRLLIGMQPQKSQRDTFHLMQYTGLKDKNGKEIYEGDVLSFNGNMTADNSLGIEPNGYIYDEDSKHEVVWNDDLAGWEPKFDADTPWKYKRDTRGLMIGANCEVIGNIYENPELLKGA